MHYIWIDESVLAAGFLVTNLPTRTAAERKRARIEPSSHVKSEAILRAVSRARAISDNVQQEVDQEKDRIIQEFISSADYQTQILSEIKGLIEQSLNQSHDFVALLKQIKANVLTIFESRFPGDDPAAVADRLPNEGAIYFAAELMLAKIDATNYLREPNLIYGREYVFTLHRFLSKYMKIYESFARQRSLDFFVGGRSYKEVRLNSDAVGAAAHALLDNLVKYAPPRSKVDVVFEESPTAICVKFQGLGPRIDPSEKERIFLPGYRAESARLREAAGMGFGLAAARVVSDALDLQLSVQQDDEEATSHPGYFLTTFSLTFEVAN